MVDFTGIQRTERMVDVFVTDSVDIEFGAERNGVEFLLGALVDQGPEDTVDGRAVDVRLDEVLIDLGSQRLHDVAPAADDREVSEDCGLGEVHVCQAPQDDGAHQDQRPENRLPDGGESTNRGEQNDAQN